MNRLSGDIIFDDSTNRLSLVPGADDVILEIKCLRCGRFSVILKQIGSDNSEYADE